MGYVLINTEMLTAQEDILCDAMASYYDSRRAHRSSGKELSLVFMNDIVCIVKNKFGVLKKGSLYIQRTFVDENGEALFLNSGIDMDRVAIRNNLFPKMINNQLT